MNDKFRYPGPSIDNATTGILRSARDIPPMHYTYKIESFSHLLDSGEEKIESGQFEAGDYKWRLSLYPSGNQQMNGNGYISLYLSMVETNDLPLNWEVKVNFKFFVYDQVRDNYLTIQDGEIRRFHKMKTEWGVAQLLSLGAFKDLSNGYLVDDCCVFGVEIFIIKGTGKGETQSMVKLSSRSSFKFKIDKYSALSQSFIESEDFTIGDHIWKLMVYPKGDTRAKGSLSLFLYSKDDSETLSSKSKLYVKYKLRIVDQNHGNHHQKTATNRFESTSSGWGFVNFVTLSDLKDASKGYLVNDTLLIEIVFVFMSVVKQY